MDNNNNNVTVPDEKRKIAYFSMEIGLKPRIPTYSGGLGILAGDTIKSCADLKVPITGVTLLYKKGYFRQGLNNLGQQEEFPVEWDPDKHLGPMDAKVNVEIGGRHVWIRAWKYEEQSPIGYKVPVIFLDTDIPENSTEDRKITWHLYGGDDRYRLMQEIVLGIGGFRMLQKLGYTGIRRYHMNEGHAALLTLELLRHLKQKGPLTEGLQTVRDMCVFTTHTPVPAGHDQFNYDMVYELLGDLAPLDLLKKLASPEKLNMTLLSMNLSKYINGVAKTHGEVSRNMFPGYPIDSISNGVHSRTWTSPSFKKVYDRYIPGWANDPFSLRYALDMPKKHIWAAHTEAKKSLIDYIRKNKNTDFEEDVLTIGFARRVTPYKRPDLIFHDVERLIDISKKSGRLQIVFSGKAHPDDHPGKDLIKHIFHNIEHLKEHIRAVYLEDYHMELAGMLVSGVDLWLNTPQRPNEASGTSGMKASHNGVPHFSILDGWWAEGHIEGITGWSIGKDISENYDDTSFDASDLYEKLEKVIIPVFYGNRDRWIDVMRNSIAINASFFNTHRMVMQYVLNAYL